MPECIRPAPNETERAQPRFMQHVQQLEVRVDRFRAFDMKNTRQHVVGEAAADVIDIAADAHAALRLALDPKQKRHHAVHGRLRRRHLDGRRRRNVAEGGVRRCASVAARRPRSRGDEDREQPSGESSLPRLGKIQVALGLAVEEGTGGFRAATPVKTQQNVVVPVEDRHSAGRRQGNFRHTVAIGSYGEFGPG